MRLNQVPVAICSITLNALVFLSVTQAQIVQVAVDEWATDEFLANKLPATLTPTSEFLANTSGECFTYCMMKGISACSSLAFSKNLRTCKLYFHPTLMKPLPTLTDDLTYNYQMYYRKRFCPYGWDADPATRKCYYAGSQTAIQRPAAWTVCEERSFSELVTFQTPMERDNLYSILSAKYPAVNKWWTGYALYDGQLWPRPVDEIPGYRAARGDCGGNDIGSMLISPQECALKCDRQYRDTCVGFVYWYQPGRCYLKTKMCDNNGNNFALGSELWHFWKVHPGRPTSTMVNSDYGGFDILWLYDVGQKQCRDAIRQYNNAMHAIYIPDTRRCCVHRRTGVAKSGSTNTISWDRDDVADDRWCPNGLRFRDVCYVFFRATKSQSNMDAWCRTQGGKLVTPIYGNKGLANAYFQQARYGRIWYDYNNLISGTIVNYTSMYGNMVWTYNAVWDFWPWQLPSEPNCAGCGMASWTQHNDATGVYNGAGDNGVNSGYYGLCEFPITQSYPKDCRFTPLGREYMGQKAMTQSGQPCKPWNSYSYEFRRFPDWYTAQSFCRSPDSTVNQQPWCYRNDNGTAELCNPIPMCPETDWAPTGNTYDDWNQPYAAITKTNSQADGYYWTVEQAPNTAAPLCQMRMTDWCPFYYRGSCYTLYKVAYNHASAQAVCVANGGYLASITTRDELYYLQGITMKLGNLFMQPEYGFHIGLIYNSTSASWNWENGEVYYNNFWESVTNSAGQCGILRSSTEGNWISQPCTYFTWFICEVGLGN